mgnify:CR=1 FL=1
MYLTYSKNQVLPIKMEGFMGVEIPCDATIVDAMYKVKVDLGNGQFSEMILNEQELKDRLIGNPQPCNKGYYQPICKYGYKDCVCDPAYIKANYPDWYKELGSPTQCEDCTDGNCYDDEDK